MVATEHGGAIGESSDPPPGNQVRPPAPVPRPGSLFQDLLLRDFRTTTALFFLDVRLPSPATIWVTPKLPVELNQFQVGNTLSFHLAAPSQDSRV